MDTVIELVNLWKDLLVNLYCDYSLAAALLTVGAIIFWFYLERNINRGKTKINTLIVLGLWVISVPIIGLILNALSKIWKILEGLIPILGQIFHSFYLIYDKHPIFIISLIVIGFIFYFVWKIKWPTLLPNRWLRIIVLIGCIIAATYIINPILNIFIKSDSVSTKDTNSSTSQSSSTKSNSIQKSKANSILDIVNHDPTTVSVPTNKLKDTTTLNDSLLQNSNTTSDSTKSP
jgi:hypothetical protein